VQACHLRAIDLSRRVAGSQGGHPKRDAYDPRNYTDGNLELLSLDVDFEDLEGQSTLGFDEPGTPHPARRLASPVDLEAWLGSLDAEDRLVLALRQAGSTLEEIGQACGRSINWRATGCCGSDTSWPSVRGCCLRSWPRRRPQSVGLSCRTETLVQVCTRVRAIPQAMSGAADPGGRLGA
jgi:hypothetical protein